MNIWYGTDENAHLSNLAHRPFKDKSGRAYRSVEHAYQSWKSGTFDADAYGRGKRKVKAKGTRTAQTKNGWNLVLMKKLIMQSFKANPASLKALLDTGNATFTHRQDRGIWRKEFPRLLMEVRDELRADSQDR